MGVAVEVGVGSGVGVIVGVAVGNGVDVGGLVGVGVGVGARGAGVDTRLASSAFGVSLTQSIPSSVLTTLKLGMIFFCDSSHPRKA